MDFCSQFSDEIRSLFLLSAKLATCSRSKSSIPSSELKDRHAPSLTSWSNRENVRDLIIITTLLIHTYRCTHALASSLLCQQYKLRSHSNSTHSTTRSQLTLSLCIPSAARCHGTISPLFTSTSLELSLFYHLLDQLLLCTLSGKSCRNISESLLLGQYRPVGFPNKTTSTTTTTTIN